VAVKSTSKWPHSFAVESTARTEDAALVSEAEGRPDAKRAERVQLMRWARRARTDSSWRRCRTCPSGALMPTGGTASLTCSPLRAPLPARCIADTSTIDFKRFLGGLGMDASNHETGGLAREMVGSARATAFGTSVVARLLRLLLVWSSSCLRPDSHRR
jgi:hypothetical protein